MWPRNGVHSSGAWGASIELPVPTLAGRHHWWHSWNQAEPRGAPGESAFIPTRPRSSVTIDLSGFLVRPCALRPLGDRPAHAHIPPLGAAVCYGVLRCAAIAVPSTMIGMKGTGPPARRSRMLHHQQALAPAPHVTTRALCRNPEQLRGMLRIHQPHACTRRLPGLGRPAYAADHLTTGIGAAARSKTRPVRVMVWQTGNRPVRCGSNRCCMYC